MCPDTIVISLETNVHDCGTYCETNGATRLTYSNTRRCRCCTASSELTETNYIDKIYTLVGK